MKKTAAVIVTYNRKTLLAECLAHLKKQTCPDLDILVIDNASTDGTQAFLRPMAEQGLLIYCNTGANLGGAGGFSYGCREAVRRGYEYLWLMDDDTLPDADALERFWDADRWLNGRWGFLSGVARWTDGTLCRMNFQRPDVFTHLTEEELARPVTTVSVATFVSFLVKASVVRKVGLPISDFFIWSDDVEYSDRIAAKYPCYRVRDSRVLHKMNNNDGVDFAAETGERFVRFRYCYRNEVYIYRRHGARGWCYVILKDLYHAVRVLLKSKGNRGKKEAILISGFRDGLHFHPDTEFVGEDESK